MAKKKAKKARNERTSKRVATDASEILRDPRSTATEKRVAASALTQARDKRCKIRKRSR